MAIGKAGARGGTGSVGVLGTAGNTFPLAGAVIDEKFTTGSYSPRGIALELVNTNSSSVYVTDASGNLALIAANALPISNTGLLDEAAATNLLFQSQNQSVTWARTDLNVGATTTAPDGTNTAQLISQAAITGAKYSIQTKSLGNGTFVYSVYYKGSGANFALEMTNAAANSGAAVVFDTVNNVVAGNVILGSGLSVVASGLVPVANGFYRAYAVITTTGGTANVGFWQQTGTGLAWFPSVVGNTSNGVYLWGFQVETDNGTHLPSSYIPTTTVGVTRNAPSIVIQRTGLGTLVVTYDNNSTETLYPNFSGQYTIPANLTRSLIKRITGYAAQPSLRQAVSTTSYANSVISAAQGMSRQTLTAMKRIDSVQISVPMCYGISETIATGTTTVTAAVEYNGVVTQIKFSGGATGTATGVKWLDSDEVSVPSIPAGASFAIRLWRNNTTSVLPAFATWAINNGFTYGATVADATMSTASVTDTLTGAGAGVCVVATRHNSRAAGCVGDSIDYGQGTGANYAPNSGLFVPALSSLMPTINLGMPADTLNNFITANGDARRHFAAFCTSFPCNFGVNDLSGSRTAVQIEADQATMESQMSGPVIWSTITPAATSSDDFATSVNQSANALAPQRALLNDYRRAAAKYFEIADALEFGRNSCLWRSVGDGSVSQQCTSTSGTWGGIHPTSYAYGLANAVVAANVAYVT